MTIRFLDLSVSTESRRDYLAAIDKILETGIVLNGPEVGIFERQVAEFCGTEYAVGVASGTASLYLALQCMRIETGDEVILPALSFVGTANAVAAVGATPVFVDIRRDMLVDPDAIESAVNSRTKAIMPVHFTGNVCNMEAIDAIGMRYSLPIIEDAAPAFGATYRNQRAGSFGRLGCFSMNPMKILGAIGEAGIVVTNSRSDAERLYNLRYHGLRDKEICEDISLNGRLDTIQAAILSIRMQSVEDRVQRRETIAKRYATQLSNVVEVPRPAPHIRSSWYTYTILCDRRDDLYEALKLADVECKIYHTKLMPDHPAYSRPGHFPVGRSVVRQLLCLPMHEKLTDDEVDHVCQTIANFYGRII